MNTQKLAIKEQLVKTVVKSMAEQSGFQKTGLDKKL